MNSELTLDISHKFWKLKREQSLEILTNLDNRYCSFSEHFPLNLHRLDRIKSYYAVKC